MRDASSPARLEGPGIVVTFLALLLATLGTIVPAGKWLAQENATRAQAPAATLKVEAISVVVDVIVTDKKGRHVSGLTADDFRISEDNVPQTIVTFVPPVEEGSHGPGSQPAGGVPSRAPSVSPTGSAQREGAQGLSPTTTEREARALAGLRFITIVMDLGDLQPGSIKRAYDAAVEYLRKYVAPEDFVAIYTVDSSLRLSQPFTQDKQQAIEAMGRVARRVPTGRFTAMERSQTQEAIEGPLNIGAVAPPQSGGGAAETMFAARSLATLLKFYWAQSAFQARTVFVALRAIAQAYADIPGRKNVVVFSEGFMHSPEAMPAMQAVIDAANRANVAFYLIDASGLAPTNYSAESTLPPDAIGLRENFALGAMTAADGIATGLDKFDWLLHVGQDIIHDDLRMLTSATGGLLMRNQNDLLAGLSRVDSDLREFYTLVYQPSHKTYDGAFRRINVEVLKPGLRVRHRQGYWAIPPGQEMFMTPAAAQLLASLASGVLKPGFSPQLNAAVLLAPNGQFAAPVHVSVPTKHVKFEKDPQKDLYRAGITLVVVGRDSTGKLTTVHQRFLKLDLNKKQLDEFQKRQALDINARLAVPTLEPLELEAILQLSAGAVGLSKQGLRVGTGEGLGPRLTGLLLSNRIEPASGPADSSDPLRGPNFQLFLPAAPRFAPSDQLTVYFGALDVSADPTSHRPALRLAYTIKQGGEAVRELPPEQVVGTPDQKQFLVLKQFNLAGLRPGPYTLEVRAEDLSTRAAVSEEADFVVQ